MVVLLYALSALLFVSFWTWVLGFYGIYNSPLFRGPSIYCVKGLSKTKWTFMITYVPTSTGIFSILCENKIYIFVTPTLVNLGIEWPLGLGLFGTDISARDVSARTSRGHFSTRTFWHKNILVWVYFGTMDVSEQGRYGTGTFWHKDIEAHGRLDTICQNFLVPKCPRAEKFLWWNDHAEMSLVEMSGTKISTSHP